MKIDRIALAFFVFFSLILVTPRVSFAAAISEEEAQSIAVDAYVYFYPLITMDVTRKQLTNAKSSPGAIGGPPNTFNNLLDLSSS